MSAKSHPSVRIYLAVFAGLALLTGLTVILSYLGLSTRQAIPLAALIALAKCFLIASFFMHLRTEGKVIRFTLYTALFFVVVLIGSLIQDIAFPGY